MSNDPTNIPEMELDDIAKIIFSKPAGPPRSICLDFDQETIAAFSKDDNDPELMIYSRLALLGVKILYGKDRDFTTLTKDEFNTVQQYMKSMGVKLKVRCNEDNQD